jgi:hypothetical protein
MVQLPRISIVALVLLGTASAQISEDALKSKIIGVHYSPLAEQAQIQGNVHLTFKAGAVTVLSGHPLLAETAVQSTKALAAIQTETSLDLTYHFVLVDNATSVPTSMTVPRGNAFERAVLRFIGLRTEKVIVYDRCQKGVPPPNDLKIVGAGIEIWIYGVIGCLNTDAATLSASR